METQLIRKIAKTLPIVYNMIGVFKKRRINMTFGEALEELKKGKKVARNGWNGKNQFLTLGTEFTYVDCNGKAEAKHETSGTAAIVFHGTIGVQVGWLASQSDMLSEDWMVVGE